MKKGLIKVFGVLGIVVTLILSFQVLSHAALSYQQMYVSSTGTTKVMVLVNSAIYSAIYDPSLKQYVADLEAEGYYVILTKFISGTPPDVKNYLKSISGLKGAVLIGDLPIPRFEQSSSGGWEVFPWDMFYRDLDGNWTDADGNGIYDSWGYPATGNCSPEIWVSRLAASTVHRSDMSEAAMLKNYFSKNHSYRLGKLTLNKRALEYSDFTSTNLDLYVGLKNAYSNLLVISDDNTTSAADYRIRLTQNYEWLYVMAHSSPRAHSFLSPNEYGNNSYYVFLSTEVPIIKPKVLFYFLGGCSCCKFDESDYIGGHYIFDKDFGILAIGSSTPWSPPNTPSLYSSLGPNYRKSAGEAGNDWLKTGDFKSGNYLFSFGPVTFLGDGTLTLDPPIPAITSITPSTVAKGQAVTFVGSGSVPNSSIVGYSWRSSISGNLGSTSTVKTSALSVGTHTIYFKVKDSKGRWSSETQATLVVIPVAAPSNLAATVPARGIYLSWKDNSFNEVGFEIETSKDNVTYTKWQRYISTGVQTLTTGETLGATITPVLTSKVRYYFRVRAYNSDGYSSYSNVIAATPN